jgi:hypothetical protein
VSRAPESLLASIAAVWRGEDGTPPTRPLLIASICAGIAGFTLAAATGLPIVESYVLTVVVVFAIATAVLVARRR